MPHKGHFGTSMSTFRLPYRPPICDICKHPSTEGKTRKYHPPYGDKKIFFRVCGRCFVKLTKKEAEIKAKADAAEGPTKRYYRSTVTKTNRRRR